MKETNMEACTPLEVQYAENERQTNRMVAFVSLVFVVICIYTEFAVQIDYSIGVHTINRYLFMPISALILLCFIIARIQNYSGFWVKYMLLAALILMAIGAFLAYTVYMSYMLLLPIFLSGRYFNKKFLIQVSVTTLVLFFIACYLNLRLQETSDFVQLLHRNASYDLWSHPVDAVIFLIAPITMTFLFITVHSISEARSGKRLMQVQAESMLHSAAMEAELNMAAEIQKSALPDGNFMTPNGNFCIAAQELPAKEVCGDFYDYFMVGERFLTVVIADVSDKGAAAAMFMMSAKKAVQCAVQGRHELDKAAELTNKLICQDNKSGMFLTLWLGIIDTCSGMGKYINAGHPMPLLRHADGTVTSISNQPDLFLGNFPEHSPKSHPFRMAPGDTLLLYTDGVTDAVNPEGNRFGAAQLETAIGREPDDARKMVDRIILSVTSFSGASDQFDDITLLALQCSKLDEPVCRRFDLTSDAAGTKTVIDGVDALLVSRNCPDETRRNVDVITDEWCANLSEYAYEEEPGRMIVEAVCASNYVTLRFIDFGPAFNPLEVQEPQFTDAPMIGGLGIFFVRTLADEMIYQREEDRNILTVTVIWDL